MTKRNPDLALQLAQQYASELLRSIGHTDPVYVDWGDKNTAYTDGITIYYPREFLGVKLYNARLTKKLTWIIKGFTLHELCHFLQDLSQIDKVQNDTGLNSGIVNLILDAVGEQKLQKCWPKEWRNLVQLRSLVRKTMLHVYKQALMTRGLDFFGYASNALLCGRFWRKHTPFVVLRKASAGACAIPVMRDIHWPDKPMLICPHEKLSFAATLEDELLTCVDENTRLQPYWRMGKNKRAKQLTENGDHDLWARRQSIALDYYKVVDQARALLQQGGDMLASYLWSFAQKWPELCDKSTNKIVDPLWGSLPGSYARNDKAIAQNIFASADKHIAYNFTNSRRFPPLPESVALYNQLQFRLPLVESILEIAAPERLNRRQLVTGAPLPWCMSVTVLEQQKGIKAILCLDISGSMQFDIKEALIAAQAVTMALESNRVHVSGVLFETYSYTEKYGTSSNLFPDEPTLERIYALTPSPYPMRGGTSFLFLEKLWRQNPDAKIFVVTDGCGHMPENVSQADKDRTTVIQLRGSYNCERIATKIHVINQPHELAGIILDQML